MQQIPKTDNHEKKKKGNLRQERSNQTSQKKLAQAHSSSRSSAVSSAPDSPPMSSMTHRTQQPPNFGSKHPSFSLAPEELIARQEPLEEGEGGDELILDENLTNTRAGLLLEEGRPAVETDDSGVDQTSFLSHKTARLGAFVVFMVVLFDVVVLFLLLSQTSLGLFIILIMLAIILFECVLFQLIKRSTGVHI